MTKISIITVCFNESEEKIKYTFESILNQSYKALEFIVVDGGSRGSTLDALHSWATKINRFVSEPDKGIFDAMNKGVKLATGDWICFMNVGDAFYNSEALSNLIRADHGIADILYGDVYKADFGLITSPGKLTKYVFYDSGICHQAMLSRKSVFEKIGDFDLTTDLYGDADWVMRAFSSGVSFLYVPEIVCFYEGGGATSDHTIFHEERQHYLKKYFNNKQRTIYLLRSLSARILNRIIQFNLSIPYSLRAWLSKPKA